MDLRGLEPTYIEKNTLEGLERLGRGLSAFLPEHLRRKYARFAEIPLQDQELVDLGPTPKDLLSVQLALDVFYKLNRQYRLLLNDTSSMHEGLDFFRLVSFTICKLGGEASPGDVEFYFERKLKEEKAHVAYNKKLLGMEILPQRILAQAAEALATIERLKLLRAPTIITGSRYKRWGGRKKLTLEERTRFNIGLRLSESEKRVTALEELLSELQSGNPLKAMLELGEEFQLVASIFEDEKSTYFDEESGDLLPKDGELSVFVRATSKGPEFDFDGAEYYLYRSLLNVLQPTVGQA